MQPIRWIDGVDLMNPATRQNPMQEQNLQQRLMQLNPAILDQLVSNMKQSKPDIKLSDEQLIGALKSRYIQSNADVYAWTRAVQADLDSTISSIEAEATAQVAKTAEAAAGQESGV